MQREKFKVLLYLKKGGLDKSGQAPIMGRITHGRTMAQFSCKLSCDPDLWNARESRLNGKSREAVATNGKLERLLLSVQSAYRVLCERDAVFTATDIKEQFQGSMQTQITFLERYDRMVEEMEQKVGIEIKATTLNSYYTISKHLQAFIREKYEAVERKPCFLSKGEVAKLLAFPLQDEGAELSRRMFLFSVFTGLAFADLQSLRASQIETNNEGKRYIRKTRQKTEVESLIPLHPIAEQILALYTKEKSKEDYKNNNESDCKTLLDRRIFPDTMSKGKLLTHLKAVGLACGIRTPLSYHAGRHSFGTLTLEAGIPIESIAKMMGHSSIASTQIYAQITDQKIARDMDKITKHRNK